MPARFAEFGLTPHWISGQIAELDGVAAVDPNQIRGRRTRPATSLRNGLRRISQEVNDGSANLHSDILRFGLSVYVNCWCGSTRQPANQVASSPVDESR